MPNIERSVVELDFDGSKFARGVEKTTSMLDRLKSMLNFRGASSGIEEVNGAIGRFNVSPIQNGLMGIQNQFSVLQTIATGALLTIGNKVVELGSQLAGGLSMRPVIEGFQEYETKIGSIQTIYANTHEKYGTGYDDITKALDELNTYADKTIYNFGDMTRNIGLFTNAGLELGPSVSMIKGFSNAAASSGTDAQRAAGAAYQLSQGLSQGRITLMDWNSLVNAGMGNAVMKQGLVDIAHAMGALDRSTMATSEAIEGEFRDSLQKGWLTSDVMSTYLQIMSGDMDDAAMASKGLTQEQIEGFKRQMEIGMEAATKTRTFSALMDTIQESVGSGWGQTFEILFGEFEEATELWSGIGDTLTGIIGKSTEARNALLQSWSDLGGRAAVLDGLKNTFQAFFKIAETVGKTFRTVFAPIKPEQLVAASQAFKKFTDGLAPTPRLLSIIERSLTGVFKFLHSIGEVVGLAGRTVFAFFDRLGKSLSYFKTSDEAIWSNPFVKMGDALGYVASKISNFVDRANPAEFFEKNRVVFHNFASIILSVGDIFGAVFRRITGFISAFSGALSDTFGGNGASLLTSFTKLVGQGTYYLARGLENVVEWLSKTEVPVHKMRKSLRDFFESIKSGLGPIGDFLGVLSNIKPIEIFSNGLSHIGDVMGGVSKVIGGIFIVTVNTLSKLLSSMSGIGDVFSAIGSAIGDAFSLIVDKAGDFAKDLAEALSGKDFSGILDIVNTAIFASLAVMLKQFLGSGSLISQIKEAIFGGGDDEEEKESFLQKAKKLIIGDDEDEGILDKAKESITEAFEPLTDTLETMQNTLKATTLMQIAIAVAALAGSVVLLSAIDSAKLTKALTAITVMFTQLAGMLYVIQAMNLGKVGATLPLLGLGLMAIAAAIGMLVIPVIALSQLSWDELTRGLVGVVGIMAMFATLGPQLSASSKGMISAGIGLSILATGIGVLAVSVKILGSTDLPSLAKGLGSVAILLGALMLFEKYSKANVIGVSSGAGILLLAGGIAVMAGAVKILSSLSIGDTVQSLFALSGALMVISMAMNAMPKNLPAVAAGMLLLSGALVGISASLVLISTMSGVDSFQSIITLAAALTILSVAVNTMSGALAGAAALVVVTLALGAFIPILITLGSLPWQVIAMGLGSIAAAFAIFAAAGYLLTPVVPTILGLAAAILALSVSISVILGSITLVVASLALLAIGISQLANTGTQALTDLINIIPLLFKALADGIVSMLATITDAGTQIVGFVVTIIQSVLTAIQTTLPQIVETVRMILTSLFNLIIEMTPQLVNAFIVIGIEIIRAINVLIPPAIEAATNLCLGILNAISTLSPVVVQTGVDMIMALVNGIVALVPQLVDAGMQLIVGILDGIAQNIGQVIDKGTEVIVNFVEGIGRAALRVTEAAAQTLITFMNGLADSIRNNSQGFKDAGLNIATAIIDGISGGLLSKMGGVVESAKSVAKGALDSIKSFLGIHSPSRVMRDEVGRHIATGIATGMDKNHRIVEKSGSNVGLAALNSVRDVLSNPGDMDMSISPRVRPVLDMSSFNSQAYEGLRGDISAMTSLGVRDYSRAYQNWSEQGLGNSQNIQFIQNNTSPKALSPSEIYRNTNSQLARFTKKAII